jgi:hypothetical protein
MRAYQARQQAAVPADPTAGALPPLTEALPAAAAAPPPPRLTLPELLAVAERAGVRRSQVEASARRHHGVDDLARLTADQLENLHHRLLEFISRERGKGSEGAEPLVAANGAAEPAAIAATRPARPGRGG